MKPHRFENASLLAAVSNRRGFDNSFDRCRVNGRCNRIDFDVVTNETNFLQTLPKCHFPGYQGRGVSLLLLPGRGRGLKTPEFWSKQPWTIFLLVYVGSVAWSDRRNYKLRSLIIWARADTTLLWFSWCTVFRLANQPSSGTMRVYIRFLLCTYTDSKWMLT